MSEFIKDGPLFSYGYGIGYLESLLLQDRKQLYLTDFDDFCLRYNSESQFIYNLEENSLKFKHILLSQVVYSLTDTAFLDIVDFLRIKLLPNGSLVITFESDKDYLSDELSFISKTFTKLKNFFYFVKFLSTSNFSKWQGWGYNRSLHQMLNLVKKSNPKDVRIFSNTGISVISVTFN